MKESKIKVLQDRNHRYKLRRATGCHTPAPIIAKKGDMKVLKDRKKRYKLRRAPK